MTLITHRKPAIALVCALALIFGLVTPAGAQSPGYIDDQIGVGYFYGTFGESPNTLLMAGGSAQDFCEAEPDNPFNGNPMSVPGRIFLKNDGSTDIKANAVGVPIHLYHVNAPGPVWLGGFCAGYFAGEQVQQPFASGEANLKVRITEMADGSLDIFNGVTGKASGTNGAEYRVRGWADFVVVDGMPTTDPSTFVGFELKEVGN